MNKNIELGKNVKIGNNVIFGDNIKKEGEKNEITIWTNSKSNV